VSSSNRLTKTEGKMEAIHVVENSELAPEGPLEEEKRTEGKNGAISDREENSSKLAERELIE